MPVISVTGPRQSGKTTLVKQSFPDYNYVTLENIENRDFAKTDPKGFLNTYGKHLIIDEAQYVPDLFSYIQTLVDEANEEGMYILTGSQNFLLLQSISQSLAGRVAIFHLLPFSIEELASSTFAVSRLEEVLYKGFYPRIYDKQLNPPDWHVSYLETYVEKDVRQILNIGDLRSFRQFMGLCAGRVGQLLNLSAIANELGVSYHTVKSWLSVLEATFIIYLLQPYHKSYNKRLVKSPKLYFHDVGLASYLLGIRSEEQIGNHYAKEALFENMVLSELIKSAYNQGGRPALWFWRNNAGNEVDCIIEKGLKTIPVEIKAGKTIRPQFFKNLLYWSKLSEGDPKQSVLIYGGNEKQSRSNGSVIPWNHIASVMKEE